MVRNIFSSENGTDIKNIKIIMADLIKLQAERKLTEDDLKILKFLHTCSNGFFALLGSRRACLSHWLLGVIKKIAKNTKIVYYLCPTYVWDAITRQYHSD